MAISEKKAMQQHELYHTAAFGLIYPKSGEITINPANHLH
jgi:hypothetical protein